MKTQITFIAALAAFAGACDQGDAEPQAVSIEDVAEARSAELPVNVKDTDDYFIARQDMRRCAYPMCGGYFLDAVNYELMVCPDGSVDTECYVSDLDTPVGIGVETGDLVHGWFGTHDVGGSTWANFESDFVYESTAEEPWDVGSHNLIFNTGILCVTTPCPSQALAHLNHDWSLNDFEFFFWGNDAAEDQLLEDAFWAEYGADTSEAGGGALTFGDFWILFGNVFYSVYDVYTLKVADAPVCVVHDLDNTATAWSFASEAAAQDLIAGLEGTVTIYDGNCGDQQLFCPAVYMPVHGEIDANGDVCEDHGNACEFRSAVIAAAGENKATGEYFDGPC